MIDKEEANHTAPGLNLGADLDPGQQNQAQAKQTSRRKARKTNRPSGSRQRRSKANSQGEEPKLSWAELKSRFQARLAGLDREKLKRVLLACGLGAAVVGAVLLAIKLMPVGLTILALLGLGLSLQLWERLRWFPPFI